MPSASTPRVWRWVRNSASTPKRVTRSTSQPSPRSAQAATSSPGAAMARTAAVPVFTPNASATTALHSAPSSASTPTPTATSTSRPSPALPTAVLSWRGMTTAIPTQATPSTRTSSSNVTTPPACPKVARRAATRPALAPSSPSTSRHWPAYPVAGSCWCGAMTPTTAACQGFTVSASTRPAACSARASLSTRRRPTTNTSPPSPRSVVVASWSCGRPAGKTAAATACSASATRPTAALSAPSSASTPRPAVTSGGLRWRR